MTRPIDRCVHCGEPESAHHEFEAVTESVPVEQQPPRPLYWARHGVAGWWEARRRDDGRFKAVIKDENIIEIWKRETIPGVHDIWGSTVDRFDGAGTFWLYQLKARAEAMLARACHDRECHEVKR